VQEQLNSFYIVIPTEDFNPSGGICDQQESSAADEPPIPRLRRKKRLRPE